jgi:GAF domain-containing protein
MNQMDHDMDNGFSDDIKANFNKINDKVFEIYNLQEKIIYEFKASGGANPRDVERLVNKTRSIGRKHNAFLNSTDEVVVDIPETDLITEDSIKVWAVLFFVFAIIILMVSWLIGYLRKPIISIESALGELRNGDFPEDLKIRSLDHKPSGRAINVISKKLRLVRDYTTKVGVGDFEVKETDIFDRDGMLGNSLANMQENLQRIAERDRQREHINKGLASFSDILSSHTNNLMQFAEEVTHNLVGFLNANQGAMFIVMDEDAKSNTMEMYSCYAYNTKKHDKKIVKKGQGLVGQAWVEKKRIYMTDVPNGYTKITSGLGYSTPRCILIVPLIFNDEVHGVLELASFGELQDYELDFVDEVTDSISSSLSSVKINSQTQELLKQSEQLTATLTQQEEDMRKKVEELAVIQNEAQLREEKQIREIRRLENRIKTYERHV